MTVGPLTSESVTPALLPTATGIVVGFGEILGGGLSPAVAGFAASHFGLPSILYVALSGSLAGLLLSFLLKEQALEPRRSRVREALPILPAPLPLKD